VFLVPDDIKAPSGRSTPRTWEVLERKVVSKPGAALRVETLILKNDPRSTSATRRAGVPQDRDIETRRNAS
jgi:hypothetical protein